MLFKHLKSIIFYFFSSWFLGGNLGRATGDRFKASTKVRDGYDILKRTDGCPCIRRIILSESYSSWRSVSRGKCILFLWGSEDREQRSFPTRSCWLLLDAGLHQGLLEAESQNRRAFALFTIVVLNGQKITDRICHVLPLSLTDKETERQFESWAEETRNQNTSFKYVGR